jgi:hypothetical protein
MMSDNYWKERFFSLKRWVEQQPNISEAAEKDWEDFWYNSITVPTLEEVWNEVEEIEPLTPKIKGDTNGIE